MPDMFATNFTGYDWGIVSIYLVGIGIVGVFVNRYIHNVSDYMVAGRGAGTALNAATFLATGLCLVTVMYSAIDGFNKGFSYMVLGLIGTTVGLLLGTTGFVIRRLRAAKLITLPEYFERRYSRGVRVTAGAICALAGILNMGLFPKMGATFVTYSTGLGATAQVAPAEGADTEARAASSTPAGEQASPAGTAPATREAIHARQELMVNIVMTIVIAIVLIYTVSGGMVAVIVTDYFQFVLLSLGLGVGLYFCLTRPDLGWDGIVAALKQHRGERAFNPVHSQSYGWYWVIWMIIHFAAAALCWAPEASRTLTAKDPETARKTFLYSSPGQFIRLAIPALFGIAAFCFVSQSSEMAAHFFPKGLSGDSAHADQAMPLMMGKIVPAGLLGLLLAGMMSALMSTHDSYFLCWASVIVRDVIAPLKGRPMSDKEQIRITRITIIGIGIFLLVWGVWYELPESVWNYMAVTGSVYLCGSIVILIGGMYWRGASSAGALAAILGGLASVVIIFLPESVRGNTALMGIAGLANYALCTVLFVAFSLLFPDSGTPQAQEA